jgi:hypothetical protein
MKISFFCEKRIHFKNQNSGVLKLFFTDCEILEKKTTFTQEVLYKKMNFIQIE